MADTLRDLVVSLSLNTDNFTRNINSVNKQIREAESYFKLAGAGVKDFDTTTAGLAAQQEMLTRKLELQRNIVDQYQKALAEAQAKLQECADRHADYTDRLEQAKEVQADEKERLDDCTRAYETLRDAYGEMDAQTQQAKADMEAQQDVYDQATEAVIQLSGQCDALQRSAQNAADGVSTAQTQLNKAEAAVRETEEALEDCNERFREATQAAFAAQSSWTQAGEALQSFSERAIKLGEDAEKLGQKLTNALSKKIVDLGKKAVQASMDFESSFALVRKTVNGTEADFEKLAAQSKEMSTQIATSTSDINKVMATGGQLGIATEYIADFARTMIDLSIASTDLDADTAATQLAKFANIMGTDQSLFSNMGSTIAMLGNNFATTEAPIAEMAMRIAGAGKQVGLTEAQVLGLATALSSVGIQAQAGGSSISKMLINMEVAAVTGGDALADFAAVTGLSAEEFVRQWKSDPIAVFQRFITSLAEMSDEGISAIGVLQDMGIKEIRLRDTMLRAVNATELFADAQTMANAAWEENTALAEKAATKYGTTASQLANLKNKGTLLLQTFGDDLNPMVEKLIAGVSSFADKLLGLDEGQRQIIIRIAGIVAAAGPLILVFGKITKGIGHVTAGIASFMLKVGAAGGGMSGFLSVLASGPAIWIALAAAVAYGTWALIDWASGARAAREATKALNEEAKNWKDTVANTLYDTGTGDALARFGLSKDDFAGSGLKEAQSWLSGLVKVWTDGEKETDQIVKDFTESFTQGSEEVRESIQAQADLLNDYDVMTPEAQAQLDADLKKLDAWDREVEALLKKRQNGFLTEEEQRRLDEIITQRAEIQLKYSLDTDSGYEQILTQMEAELERMQHGGRVDNDLLGDTLNALAQGRMAYMDALEQSYDAEYAQIQLIQDEAARVAALDALNTRYNERRIEGEKAYEDSVKVAATAAWNENDAVYQEQINMINDIAGLIGDGKDLSIPAVQEMIDAFKASGTWDEGKLTSMIALVEQLKAAGMSDEDLLGMGIDYDDIISKIEQIRDLAASTEGLGGLSELFGTALPEEIQRIMIGLDMTQAAEDWAAFASGESLLPLRARMDPIDATTVVVSGTVPVDGTLAEIGKDPTRTYEISGFSVDVDGKLKSVTTKTGETYAISGFTVGVDGKLETITAPDGETYYVSGTGGVFKVDVDGRLKDVSSDATITYDVDGGGYTVSVPGTLSDIAADPLKKYDIAGFNVGVDGKLKSVTTKEGETYGIAGFTVGVDGTLQSITAENGENYYVGGTGGVFKVDVDGRLKDVSSDATITYDVDGGGYRVGVPGVLTDIGTDPLKTYGIAGFNVDVNGKLASITTKEGETYEIADFTTDVDGTLQSITTKEGVTYYVSGTEGVFKVDVDGRLSKVDAKTGETYTVVADVNAPCNIKLNALDQAAITAWETANKDKAIEGPKARVGVKLGATWASDLQTAYDAGLLAVWGADGASLDVTPEVVSQITANDIALYDEDGTLHVIVKPEFEGTEEAIEEAREAVETEMRAFTPMGGGSSVVTTPMALIAAAERRIANAQAQLENLEDDTQHWWTRMGNGTLGADSESVIKMLDTSMALDFDPETVASLSTYVGELVTAIQNGEEISEEDVQNLQDILTFLNNLDTMGVGENVSEGIGAGMEAAGWGDSAQTVAQNLQDAINAALGIASPSTLMMPTGEYAAQGVGEGMANTDMSGYGRSVASGVQGALKRNLTAYSLRTIGRNAMDGLAAGIRAGKSEVVKAMVEAVTEAIDAAKEAGEINSPSRVFRDEVGAMMMKGLGEGIIRETAATAKTIANASRYLTAAARESAIGYTQENWRETYNYNSTVDLTGNNFYVRSDQDVRDLAVEIAALTKRQQRGRGLRLA